MPSVITMHSALEPVRTAFERLSASGQLLLLCAPAQTSRGNSRLTLAVNSWSGKRSIAALQTSAAVAALPLFLKTYIDRQTFSFTDYLRSEKDSSTELHQWIRKSYFNFRELELSMAL